MILSLDFANEYHSRETLDVIGVDRLKIGDRLLHTYDGKSCQFNGIGRETINTSLSSLGNKSLIEYHQQKGNPLPQNIDVNTFLLKVIYDNYQGKVFAADHIPQLLKKIVNRADIKHQVWEEQLLSLEKKVELAIQPINFINKKFILLHRQINFDNCLRQPQSLIYLLQGNNSYNLDFGGKYFAKPSGGLHKKYLLEKPPEIKASILYPQQLEKLTHNYLDKLKELAKEFKINLRRCFDRYQPKDCLNINQICQQIKDCDLVIAIISDGEEDDFYPESNPYKRIKNQLISRKIPSQMITYATIKKGWNFYIGYNLILGINAKLGYINWKLKQLKGNTQAFLGLDIGRKDGKAVGASAFLLDGEGQLLGWSNKELKVMKETFDRQSLRDLILDLFSLYQRTYNRPLQHLVIHRDGELKNEEYQLLSDLNNYLQDRGLINLDAIEIIKQQTCRAVEISQQENKINYTNPDKGYIWQYCPNEALILTTGKQEAKVSKNSSPRPLKIRQRMGKTDLMTLAEQVYWLSEMQIGSLQTIRLPITTYYADRAAQYALEGLLPLGLQQSRQLWFL